MASQNTAVTTEVEVVETPPVESKKPKQTKAKAKVAGETAPAKPKAEKKRTANTEVRSRPSIKRTISLNSLQAQRVMNRSFKPVSNSLFSIDVILRIIGDQTEIDEVESIIEKSFAAVQSELEKSKAQLSELAGSNNVSTELSYSDPMKYDIEITSPQVSMFAAILVKMDDLMGLIDALWLHGVLNSHQRSKAVFQWQQRLIHLSSRITTIEKRARESAHRKGKGSEVPESENTDDVENELKVAEAEA